MTEPHNWQHWRLQRDENSIYWLTLDRADERVNTINAAVFSEFNAVLDVLEAEPASGLVICSGKQTGFIVGADITQFSELHTAEQAETLIAQGQETLRRLAALPMPTVAVIEGFCLGGGFEFALACDYRVADDTKALLGLPEVKLGILPGWGGTVRLPRLIGALAALPYIIQGRMLSAKRAKRLGAVDIAKPARQLRRAALDLIARQPKRQPPAFWQRFASTPGCRWAIGLYMQRQLKQHGVLRAHYPAPYRIVSNWMRFGLSDSAFRQELKSIAELMMTPTSRQLVRVFFLQAKLKGLAKAENPQGKRVHVIGAGTMGGDIAAWCALRGYTVTLQDQSHDRLAPAMGRAAALYKKKLKDPAKAQYALDRLLPDVLGEGIAQADYIIEAVFEDLAVKQALFQDIVAVAKPGAILATNTSSIPLEEIASVLPDPTRLIGLHFFNPVAKMQLVEVVVTNDTPEAIKAQALAMVKTLDRLPLPVKSAPGFLVNRILMPYLLEAITLFDEGVSIERIDQAALQYGMPMGPITLADRVGLDVCYHVAKNLLAIYGGQMPACLRERVESGCLGLKVKEGFYRYDNKRVTAAVLPMAVPKSSMSEQDLCDRMMLRLHNEAVACWREGIVDDVDLIDAGMIFGTGFAPFRGGPMAAISEQGVEQMSARMQALETHFGERFSPDAGWSRLAEMLNND